MTSVASSSSGVSNVGRVTGLGTGLDIESIIEQTMKAKQAPLNKLKQQQQLLTWKQDAYREQNTALSSLYDLVRDLRYETTYNTRKATTTNSQAVNATAAANSLSGTYSINVSQLATAAVNSSQTAMTIGSSLTGNYITEAVIDAEHNQFSIVVDGVAKTITLPPSAYGTYKMNPVTSSGEKSLDDLAGAIQTQLNGAGFAVPVYAKATTDNELVFYTKADGANHTLVMMDSASNNALGVIGFHNKATSKALVSEPLVLTPDQKIVIDSNNKKFKIALGDGSYQEVTLDEKDGGYTIAELAAEIETKVRALGGDYDKVRVSTTNYNQLCIETVADDNKPLSIKLGAASTADALDVLRFSDGVSSNTGQAGLNTSASLISQKDRFLNSDFFDTHYADPNDATKGVFSFSINGQSFTFNVSNTLDEIINGINSNTAAGVFAFYDSYKDKLVLTSTKTGDLNTNGPDIQITDSSNFLSQVLNITAAGEVSGKNAIVSINGYETQQQGNSFTMNNTTFNLTGLGLATITVAPDTTGIADKVQAFVDKYNTIIAAMNAEITETRAKVPGDKYAYYEPLTDDQRKELSEDQIKQWEEKAKQGVLHSDDILSGCLKTMRMDLASTRNVQTMMSGAALSGTINLSGANRFLVTFGNETREIQLDARSYSASEYDQLVKDVQQKMDAAFGQGSIQVALNGSNQLTMTTSGIKVSLNNGSSNSGLNLLGFNDGATLKPQVKSLAEIGITTATGSSAYAEKGKLYLDKDKLAAAIMEDPEGVIALLTNNGSVATEDGPTTDVSRQGIFYRLYDSIDATMKKINAEAGVAGSDSTQTVIGKQLTNIGKQITTTQDRLDAEESRLYTMYNNMDTMIARMNSQLSAILGMFDTGNSQ
jgi:flagellar hook-associated protein 2